MSAHLEQARRSWAARDWPTAVELFRAASEQHELCADDLYALSDAAWWTGDTRLLFSACESAFRKYVAANNRRRASLAAIDLAVACFLQGDNAQGEVWIGQASRLLAEEPECAEQGYLLYLLEVEGQIAAITPTDAAGAESALRAARRVRDAGNTFADPNLIGAGLLGEGRVLVKLGRVSEGMPLLDEAMATASSAQLNPSWAGNIYCNLIATAEELGDLPRARRWTDATRSWVGTMPVAVVFDGICRLHESRIHQMTGDWQQAEGAATRARDALSDVYVSAAGAASYQLGEIRRLRGDFGGAEESFAQAHALGRDPQPGLALLRLAQGRVAAADRAVTAAVVAESDRLRRVRLCAAQVEIALAAGDIETARVAVEQLAQTAETFPTAGLRATAAHARGALLLAENRVVEALPVLRSVCRDWGDVGAVWECGRVRLLLARAYRALGDEETAGRELDAAAGVFQRLGAAFDLRVVEQLRAGERVPGQLTRREAEVLALVASGRTNREIAKRLSLSEKTVARHVSNIFRKLQVSTRTAAAAFAFDHGIAHKGSQQQISPG